MRQDVVWRPLALSQLATIWTDAVDREAVRAAADSIDDQLGFNPQDCGESRSGETRILVEFPLVALFEVNQAKQQVEVLRVWRWGTRS